jgi:hypothetical protein
MFQHSESIHPHSSFYCNLCSNTNSKLAENIQLVKNGGRVNCSEIPVIGEGTYTDLSLSACMPEKEQLLTLLDPNPQRARELWSVFMRRTQRQQEVVSRGNGWGMGREFIYIYIYIYLHNCRACRCISIRTSLMRLLQRLRRSIRLHFKRVSYRAREA